MAANNSTNYQMPHANADLATTWAFLEEGISHIITRPRTGVSYPKYMALSTVIYNYCTSSNAPREGVARRTGANPAGADLYNNLSHFLVTHLGTLKDASESLQDEELLQYYAREWDQYTTGANGLGRLFTFLNRNWVKRERDEGRKDVYPVHILCLLLWKNNLSIHIQNKDCKLTSAILRLIERQRNGQEIDQELVKKVIGSFVSLGFNEADINGVCLDVYKQHFEIPFLEATEKYYKLESAAFLTKNSISDYLKKAEEWLREEEDRVERYLDANTRRPLIGKCVHVLVQENPKLTHEDLQSSPDDDKEENIKRMQTLLARASDDC